MPVRSNVAMLLKQISVNNLPRRQFPPRMSPLTEIKTFAEQTRRITSSRQTKAKQKLVTRFLPEQRFGKQHLSAPLLAHTRKFETVAK